MTFPQTSFRLLEPQVYHTGIAIQPQGNYNQCGSSHEYMIIHRLLNHITSPELIARSNLLLTYNNWFSDLTYYGCPKLRLLKLVPPSQYYFLWHQQVNQSQRLLASNKCQSNHQSMVGSITQLPRGPPSNQSDQHPDSHHQYHKATIGNRIPINLQQQIWHTLDALG